MSEELANQIRLEMDAITVRGKDCPKPLTKWSHCGLPASCLDVIKRLGYSAPTPIQSQAIPAIMSGRDIIGVEHNLENHTISLSQSAYIDSLLHNLNLADINPVMTPMDPNVKLDDFRDSTPNEGKKENWIMASYSTST